MPTNDRVTQEHAEAAVSPTAGTAKDRVTQEHVEAAVSPTAGTAKDRVTQEHVEVVLQGVASKVRPTQVHVEVLVCGVEEALEECRRNRIQLFRDWGPFWVRNPCQKTATRLERKKDWGALEATEYQWQRIHKPWDSVSPKHDFEGIDVRLNEAFHRVYDARKDWNPIEPTVAFDTLPERAVDRPTETRMPKNFP